MHPLKLNTDRLFPAGTGTRNMARRLYATVERLPIISPHGHTDPQWFADDEPWSNASALFITPDHYVFRMLYSQGIPLEDLGIPRVDGGPIETDTRKIWRTFAAHYHLFRGTPSRLWLDHAFSTVFGLTERLDTQTADAYFDHINACLTQPEFRPRALYERFNIEVLATTESPLDQLTHHRKIRESGWRGRVITAYRPDSVADPEFPGFRDNVVKLGTLTGENTMRWNGYLAAHRIRRDYFKSMGATSTDHGHPTARTCNFDPAQCQRLLDRAMDGSITVEEAEAFRGQVLTEMARMSVDDGLVLQIHPGSLRNHNAKLLREFGRDKGADMPMRTDYVRALMPMLEKFGNDRRLSVILFTLDETSYSRELAPLAGHYPVLKIGPPWWFHDSIEGMQRFLSSVVETAGFYNTVGFNDDTRAFMSIPARHDVWRRIACRFLASAVLEHRLDEDEAFELAPELAHGLAKKAYRL
jgi:glucuronate isomerase